VEVTAVMLTRGSGHIAGTAGCHA